MSHQVTAAAPASRAGRCAALRSHIGTPTGADDFHRLLSAMRLVTGEPPR